MKYYNTFTFCNLRCLPLIRDRMLARMDFGSYPVWLLLQIECNNGIRSKQCMLPCWDKTLLESRQWSPSAKVLVSPNYPCDIVMSKEWSFLTMYVPTRKAVVGFLLCKMTWLLRAGRANVCFSGWVQCFETRKSSINPSDKSSQGGGESVVEEEQMFVLPLCAWKSRAVDFLMRVFFSLF